MLRIHVLAGQALVWRSEDAREIRERHRLVGTLVGALARTPRQNVRLGLPLQLLPEEARLLAEMGAAVLVKSTDAHPQEQLAQASERQLYEQGLEESYQEQRCLAAQERRAQLANLAERIAQGRARKQQQQQGKLPDTAPLPGRAEEREHLESAFVFPRESMMVQLPMARLCLGQEEQVDWTQPSWDWPHAGHQEHETRYCVFRDLWGRGYYVTSGSKFGGDFLVYPGDPMRFHAHYIALCCPPGAPLPLCDVVAAARLGTSVKKTVLLCSAGEDGVVIYTSLQWSGLQ